MSRLLLPFIFLLIFASLVIGGLSPNNTVADSAVAVLTQHNDNQRTGANLNETILDTTNVAPGFFGKLFTRAVDGHIYAQPLYVPGVSIPDQGVHNVVYVATEHNSVYAFDADNAAALDPLWMVNLGQSAPVPADFGNRYGDYLDIASEIGITSSPVIDLATNTIYVVTFVRDTPLIDSCPCIYHHSLHALDITTGAEKYNGPVQIAGSVPGTGYDNDNEVVTFDSHQQLQRSALLLQNGIVYVAFAAYADTDPYHGWVFGYDATTLAQVSIYNATPDGEESGIWQTGEGPASDGNYVYVVTGNGTFADTVDNRNFGDTFLKLDPQNLQDGIPAIADWFTPYNQQQLADKDSDLGSMGALMITGTNYLIGGGKAGVLYQVDKTNMGHYNGPGGPDLVVQEVPIQPSTNLFNSPVLWDRPDGRIVYVWGVTGALQAFGFSGDVIQQTPLAIGSTSLPSDYSAFPGGALSLSADGADPDTGILWASHPAPSPEPSRNRPGVLRAYNASDISQELWNSETDPNDAVGIHTKFNAPTIANGRVYLGTSSNRLDVYGLFTYPGGTESWGDRNNLARP